MKPKDRWCLSTSSSEVKLGEGSLGLYPPVHRVGGRGKIVSTLGPPIRRIRRVVLDGAEPRRVDPIPGLQAPVQREGKGPDEHQPRRSLPRISNLLRAVALHFFSNKDMLLLAFCMMSLACE